MIIDNDDGTFSIKAPCSFEKPKPLSNEEILKITKEQGWYLSENPDWNNGLTRLVKAIEKAHGIQ